jgi:hypothetical protein
MERQQKRVRLSGHAGDQIRFRGATEAQVRETIQSAEWFPAELGRLECRKDFEFNAEWNGRSYAIKQVRPIFVEEENEIVVVTVYVYYHGRGERP